MLLPLLQSCYTYKWLLLAIVVVFNGLFQSLAGRIPIEIAPNFAVPDMAATGYSPQQALNWYTALGTEGRQVAAYLGMIDLVFIIPSYTLLLGSVLAHQATQKKKYPFLYHVPVIACLFDWIETITHFLAVKFFDHWSPGPLLLFVASVATQAKFLCLISSIGLWAVLYGLLPAIQYMRSRRPTGGAKED